MAGFHARIAPSELYRTVACPGWVQLADGLPPEPDTEETLEGNAADWVAKEYAQGREVAYGTPTPIPGFSVDWDMIHGAKLWRDTLGYGAVSGVPVIIERVHPTECWGEPDGWRWDPIDGVLRMPDYKYGFGLVEAFENWQLLAYAAGVMDSLNLKDFEVMIEFCIVQPRAFHKDGPVRRWRVRGDNIRALVNTAFNAATTAWPPDPLKGPPETKTGTHCLHCPVAMSSRCKTLQAAASTIASFAGRAEPIAMPPDAIGTELLILEQAAELLEARINGLRAQAEVSLRNGQRVTNYALEPGRTRLQWNEDVTIEEVVELGKALNVDLTKAPPSINSKNSLVCTPTQAINAGVDESVISAYAARPNSAMKLARVSNTDARRAFGVIES